MKSLANFAFLALLCFLSAIGGAVITLISCCHASR